MKKDISIVGAGLVGTLLSVFLGKRGYKVKIFERRADMRKAKVEAGRSINLALSDRGLLALEKVGLAEAIRDIAIPMHGRFIHNLDGTTAFQPYGREGQYINSVSRAALNIKLMNLAEERGVIFFFDHKCSGINWQERKIDFELPRGKTESYRFDLLFGSDGAFSATRLQHQLQHERFDYHQQYIDCGYKELHISPGENGDYRMQPNALHIWPRKDYMLIALPNPDKSFTGTLFFPVEGRLSFAHLDTDEKVIEFFKNTFPDVLPLVTDLAGQFFHNPTSSLVTIKCYPWIRDDHFALIGDAAHAIVPFFGQGMNCGFEDCRILDELIDQRDEDWGAILEEFQKLRKPDADAIADMAVENYTEMRERTADPKFLLQKKIEARLHERHPSKWIPAYSQVTFNPGIRYSKALERGRMQEAIMREVMGRVDIGEKWDSMEVESFVMKKLEEDNWQ